MPELGEIGLDPAVQGVPVKKKLSVHKQSTKTSKPNLYLIHMYIAQAFFWTFRKKLKPKKTQNSRKILKKLKQNSEKTQKLATPVELNWC